MKYVKYKVKNYLNDDFHEPWGMCDYSGQMYPRSQLLRQMRQGGNTVYWSGLWVYKDFIDPLDEQLKPPPVKPDPRPVRYPRPNPSIPEVF